jgi:hypothetical protein
MIAEEAMEVNAVAGVLRSRWLLYLRHLISFLWSMGMGLVHELEMLVSSRSVRLACRQTASRTPPLLGVLLSTLKRE